MTLYVQEVHCYIAIRLLGHTVPTFVRLANSTPGVCTPNLYPTNRSVLRIHFFSLGYNPDLAIPMESLYSYYQTHEQVDMGWWRNYDLRHGSWLHSTRCREWEWQSAGALCRGFLFETVLPNKGFFSS